MASSSRALDHRAPEFFPTPTFIITTNYYHYPHHQYNSSTNCYHIRIPSVSSHHHLHTTTTLPSVPPPPPQCPPNKRDQRSRRNNFYVSSTISCRDDHEFSCRPPRTWRKRVVPPPPPPTVPHQRRPCPSSAAPRGPRFCSGDQLMKGYQINSNITTVMIRNIPNRYTREMLMEFMEEHCSAENEKRELQKCATPISAFDFLYLPIDFRSKWNKGYAFVNFTSCEAVEKFFEAVHDKGWYRFHSPKIREICYARLQGKGSLVSHFERMEFPCKEFQPVVLEPACDGTSGKFVNQICVGRLIKRSPPT